MPKKKIKRNKEHFKIPKSVQDSIPIEAAYNDGIFQVGKKRYSKTYRFADINYSVASDEDQREMFLDYSAFLNAFDDEAITKITINNREVNKASIERELLLPYRHDNLDGYRKEYNEMLVDKAATANSIVQEKYITVTTVSSARTVILTNLPLPYIVQRRMLSSPVLYLSENTGADNATLRITKKRIANSM